VAVDMNEIERPSTSPKVECSGFSEARVPRSNADAAAGRQADHGHNGERFHANDPTSIYPFRDPVRISAISSAPQRPSRSPSRSCFDMFRPRVGAGDELETCGRDASHEKGELQHGCGRALSQRLCSFSTMSSLRRRDRSAPSAPAALPKARCPLVLAAPRWYLPVNRPEASGEERASRPEIVYPVPPGKQILLDAAHDRGLYSSWHETKRLTFHRAARRARPRRSAHAGKFELPM